MKLHHDVDATALSINPRRRRRAAALVIIVAAVAGSTHLGSHEGAKARHDAMRPGVTGTR